MREVIQQPDMLCVEAISSLQHAELLEKLHPEITVVIIISLKGGQNKISFVLVGFIKCGGTYLQPSVPLIKH